MNDLEWIINMQRSVRLTFPETCTPADPFAWCRLCTHSEGVGSPPLKLMELRSLAAITQSDAVTSVKLVFTGIFLGTPLQAASSQLIITQVMGK